MAIFRRDTRGFALPTILLASTILMTILVAAIASVASIGTSISDQYYMQLAREAAESGLVRANTCLEANGYVSSWEGAQLHPNTDCSGGDSCTDSSSCFVSDTDRIRTTFDVPSPEGEGISQVITSVGKVQLVRPGSGIVWRTYSYTLKSNASVDLSLNNVAFGYHHDGAYFATIAADGQAYAVGDNTYGQLGIGTSGDSTNTPKKINLPLNVRPVSLYTNFVSQGQNMFIIGNDGNLYGAGDNTYGQLGDGTTTSRNTPTLFDLPAGKTPAYVGILGKATFVTTTDSNIYATGQCASGVLGNGGGGSGCSNVSQPVRVALPTPDPSNPNTIPSTNMSLDGSAVWLRMKGGAVYAWGDGGKGQFGRGTGDDALTPIKIGNYGDPGYPKAVKVAYDGVSSYVLDDTGHVKAAGWNYFGQLGDGTSGNFQFNFVDFTLPSSATGKIIDVETDQNFVSVLTTAGEVWSAGLNDKGELGNGNTSNQAVPVQFQLPAGVKATQVYTASRGYSDPTMNNIFVVGDDGKVYGAGSNTYGQLGRNPSTMSYSSTPVALPVIDGTNIAAKSVQAGYGTVVIFTTDNRVFTLGNNADGQLGDGTHTNSWQPRATKYVNMIQRALY